MKLDFMKPDKLDPATKLTGLDYVDVPGNSSVDYKLNFYAFKETQYQLKVSLYTMSVLFSLITEQCFLLLCLLLYCT